MTKCQNMEPSSSTLDTNQNKSDVFAAVDLPTKECMKNDLAESSFHGALENNCDGAFSDDDEVTINHVQSTSLETVSTANIADGSDINCNCHDESDLKPSLSGDMPVDYSGITNHNNAINCKASTSIRCCSQSPLYSNCQDFSEVKLSARHIPSSDPSQFTDINFKSDQVTSSTNYDVQEIHSKPVEIKHETTHSETDSDKCTSSSPSKHKR